MTVDDLRGKVIYSIGRCICHVPDACRDCAYDAGHPYNECVELLLKDALSLLKAQEPVSPKVKIDTYVCGACGTRLERQSLIGSNAVLAETFNYCPECGRKVKWE